MAITAAERKNKRREKLKTQELYEQHQTNNAGYTFREREQERLDKIFEVKTTTHLNKRRKEDRTRQRKTRHVKHLKGLDPLASTAPSSHNSASHWINRL